MAIDSAQLQSLQRRQSSDLDKLYSSPTAVSGEQMATSSDMAAQSRLLKTKDAIQKQKDDQLKASWYGTGTEDPIAKRPGFIAKTLDVLSRPLKGIVGAVDYATGKTAAPSLSQAITQNINVNKRTFGDVFRDTGMHGAISAPLGFLFDVAFDPVNWATVGTAALIPRVVAGGVKAGVKGGVAAAGKAALKGAESNIAEKLMTMRSLGKKVSGTATKEAAENPGFLTRTLDNIGERGLKASDEYDALTGTNALSRVSGAGTLRIPGQKFLGAESDFRMGVGDLIRHGANNTPWVKNWFKYFDYNNAEWTRLARIKDVLLKTVPGEGEMTNSVKAFIRSQEDGIPFDTAMTQLKEKMLQTAKETTQVAPGAGRLKEYMDIDWGAGAKGANDLVDPELDKVMARIAGMEPVMRSAADATDIIKNPDIFITSDTFENAKRLAEEATGAKVSINDLKDIIGRGELGETGWKWFDDTKKSITQLKTELKFGKNSTTAGKVMEQTLDAFQFYITLFKRAKVGASLTAWTNAIVGNPTMAWMAGVNILDPMYMKRVKDASKIVRGTRGSDVLLADFLDNQDSIAALAANPTLFARTTGMSVKHLKAKQLLESVLRTGREAGEFSKDMKIEDLAKTLNIELGQVSNAIRELGGIKPEFAADLQQTIAGLPKIKPQRPSQMTKAAIEAGEGTSAWNTFMTGNEFFDSKMANAFFKKVEERAAQGGVGSRILNFAFNKMSEKYEGIDQSYKLGTVMYSTLDGFTDKELRIIARQIDLSPEDLTKVAKNGVYRYQMNMTKALELANDIYLNYNAMPAAVKVLRSLPLAGSPFASFMYGMYLKTGKTLAYNPAVFNKVSFAMNDFAGEKSPLEKGVLSDPKYAYLNDPAMYKFPGIQSSPFFSKYGIYMNMANMLPFYSLNMFSESDRSYKDIWQDRIIKTIDKSPFAKDPIASTIFDHFIQPLVWKESRPLGSFGQPVYPLDATGLQKAGYAARSLVDPVVPGFWSPIGGLVTGAALPEVIPGTDVRTSELMPSYRWRQMANAVQGKTTIGTEIKNPGDSAGFAALRSALGSAGIPIQSPVPLSYLPEGLKKKVNSQK